MWASSAAMTRYWPSKSGSQKMACTVGATRTTRRSEPPSPQVASSSSVSPENPLPGGTPTSATVAPASVSEALPQPLAQLGCGGLRVSGEDGHVVVVASDLTPAGWS